MMLIIYWIFFIYKKVFLKEGPLNKVLAESENEAKLGNQDIKAARLKNKKKTQ